VVNRKRNLFIIFIALFAAMHNPAFGMKRRRSKRNGSTLTSPAPKRRKTGVDGTDMVPFYLCLACNETFDTRETMHQHHSEHHEGAGHIKYATFTKETAHNDDDEENEDGFTRRKLTQLYKHNDNLIQAITLASEVVSVSPDEYDLPRWMELATQVAENATLLNTAKPFIILLANHRRRLEQDDSEESEEENEYFLPQGIYWVDDDDEEEDDISRPPPRRSMRKKRKRKRKKVVVHDSEEEEEHLLVLITES